MSGYIGISEDRLHHILGVARKCYQLGKEDGCDEQTCQMLFIMGWNHDVGYEFSEKQTDHPDVSVNLLNLLYGQSDENDSDAVKAIRNHGKYTSNPSLEWKILNIADMTTDPKGNDVDVMTRLNDIKERYGEHSDQYLTSCDVAIQVGLIDRNAVERDTIGG